MIPNIFRRTSNANYKTKLLTYELSKPDQKVNRLKNGKLLHMKEKNRCKITAETKTLAAAKSKKDDPAEFTRSLNSLKNDGTVTVKNVSAHLSCDTIV